MKLTEKEIYKIIDQETKSVISESTKAKGFVDAAMSFLRRGMKLDIKNVAEMSPATLRRFVDDIDVEDPPTEIVLRGGDEINALVKRLLDTGRSADKAAAKKLREAVENTAEIIKRKKLKFDSVADFQATSKKLKKTAEGLEGEAKEAAIANVDNLMNLIAKATKRAGNSNNTVAVRQTMEQVDGMTQALAGQKVSMLRRGGAIAAVMTVGGTLLIQCGPNGEVEIQVEELELEAPKPQAIDFTYGSSKASTPPQTSDEKPEPAPIDFSGAGTSSPEFDEVTAEDGDIDEFVKRRGLDINKILSLNKDMDDDDYVIGAKIRIRESIEEEKIIKELTSGASLPTTDDDATDTTDGAVPAETPAETEEDPELKTLSDEDFDVDTAVRKAGAKNDFYISGNFAIRQDNALFDTRKDKGEKNVTDQYFKTYPTFEDIAKRKKELEAQEKATDTDAQEESPGVDVPADANTIDTTPKDKPKQGEKTMTQKPATGWNDYAKGDKKQEIKDLWFKLTSGETLQEALQGYDSSFRSYVQFYKDELKKQKAKGGLSYISPDAMIDLLKSKMGPAAEEPSSTAQTTPTSVSPQQTELDVQTDENIAKLDAIIKKYKALDSSQTFRKSELEDYSILKNDFKPGSGGLRPNVTSAEIVAAAETAKAKLQASIEQARKRADRAASRASKRQDRITGKKVQEESIINESTYNRWQKLIKG